MSPPIVLLVGVFVLAAIAGPFVALRQLDAASSDQARLSDARVDLDGVLRVQLAEETALRGFVATGSRLFLEDGEAPASSAFDAQVDELRSLVAQIGIADGLALVDDIRSAHHEWEQRVAAPLLRTPRAPDALAKQTYGKLLTDEMRADAAALRDRLINTRASVERTLRRRINATVAISAGVVSLFALAAVIFAASRAAAVDRLRREHLLVDALQRTLRVEPVAIDGARVGISYASASADALVGGDLVDMWPAREGGGWFVVADVSGKGVGAARQAAFAQYALRALSSLGDDPAEVVGAFNRVFADTFTDPGAFVVLFLARLGAGGRELRYASAGHPTACLRRGDTVEALLPTGAIVGMDRAEVFATEQRRLRIGDMLVVATDGLHEARNASGATLGEESVATLICEGPREPQALCDVLADAVRERGGGRIADDLAILAIAIAESEQIGSSRTVNG